MYGLDYGQGCLNTEFGGLVGAAVLIVNIWNSCLSMASYEPSLSLDARLKRVEEAAELFGGAFVTLASDYALRYHCGVETGQANLHNLHGNLTVIYGLNYGKCCLNTEF